MTNRGGKKKKLWSDLGVKMQQLKHPNTKTGDSPE